MIGLIYLGRRKATVITFFRGSRESIVTRCGKQVTIPDTQNAYYEKEKGKGRTGGIAQLLRRIQRRRKEDENASGYANNATVDRTRSLQSDDRACLRAGSDGPQFTKEFTTSAVPSAISCVRQSFADLKVHAHTEDLGAGARHPKNQEERNCTRRGSLHNCPRACVRACVVRNAAVKRSVARGRCVLRKCALAHLLTPAY